MMGLRSPGVSSCGRGHLTLAGLLVLGALGFAGCGGSSDEETGGAPAGSATVATRDVPGFGSVLATRSGKPLYLLTADPEGDTKCVDACTKRWEPLIADGTPAAGEGAKTSLLETFKRSDGGEQVLYNGHALYTFKGQGQLAGAGTKSFGGTWFLVSADGEAIEATDTGGY